MEFIHGAIDGGMLGLTFILHLFGLWKSQSLYEVESANAGWYNFGFAFAATWWTIFWNLVGAMIKGLLPDA